MTNKNTGDIRAELARRQIRWYEVAGMLHMAPGKLGHMLAERMPMPSDVADRIWHALNGKRDVRTARNR